MYWLWIGLSGVAAGFLHDFVRGRQYGFEWYDWSFVGNRKAMAIGGTIGALIIASSLRDRWQDAVLSIVPALLVGGTVALTVDRTQRRHKRHRSDR